MTKTTNVILGSVTGSGCFCSHFRGVCTQLGQRHVPHLEIKQGSLQHHTLSLSVVANTFSDVNRCQITPQLAQWASLHDCTTFALVDLAFDFNKMTSHPSRWTHSPCSPCPHLSPPYRRSPCSLSLPLTSLYCSFSAPWHFVPSLLSLSVRMKKGQCESQLRERTGE